CLFSLPYVLMKCPSHAKFNNAIITIAPCLAGISTPAEQAQALNVGYSTVTRWLREFREQGMPGLFPETQYPRERYTPERVIVQLIFFKCCARLGIHHHMYDKGAGCS